MASKYLDAIPLPEELPIVLDKLIKAVLKDQPQNIVEYCALYFEELEVKEMRKSRKLLVDPQVRAQVEKLSKKYFSKEPRSVQKDEVIKFMRFYSEEVPGKEPFPNSIEEIMHRLKNLGNSHTLPMSEFIDTVA